MMFLLNIMIPGLITMKIVLRYVYMSSYQGQMPPI